MTLVAGFIPLIVSLLLAAAPVAALETDLPLAARFPAGSIQNTERALEALDAVTPARAQIEETYLVAKNNCLDRFFMSSCLGKAKEQRNTALRAIRKVEVEASAYLRKEKAAERDRAVAERQRRSTEPRDKPGIPFSGALRDAPPADGEGTR